MKSIYKDVKTHQVEVQVSSPFLNLFLNRLYKKHLNISNIKYIDKENISFITNIENVEVIKKSFPECKVKIKNEKGLYKIKPLIKKNKRFLICLGLALLTFLFFQNVIVEVEVIHSDKKIRELLIDELAEFGVKRLTLKKDYNTLQKIRKKILDKYPEQLEWIEIENVGMKYIVRAEERIITKIKEDEGYCNIIAKKSSIITKIISKQGMSLKLPGDYVSKGDIIIAGDITANEEVKQSVCAKGEVYGEVWYTVNVSVPLNYQEKKKTGKKRLNILYDNGKEQKTIFRPRFKNYETKLKKIFSLWGVTLYIQKEYEVNVINKKYTEKEAILEAQRQAREKVNLKLSAKERIITEKVLNNNLKNSKMEVEVFLSVQENIGQVAKYEKTEEEKPLE